MGNIRERLRHYRIQRNMLVTILASFLVFISVFSVAAAVIGMAFLREVRQDAIGQLEENVEQAYYTASLLLEHNYDYYYQLFYDDSKTISELYAGNMSHDEKMGVIRHLKGLTDRDIITQSVYLYNGSLGTIFDSRTGFYAIEEFKDREAVEIFEAADRRGNGYCARKVSYHYGEETEDENFLSFLIKEENAQTGEIHGLMINIDQSVLQELVLASQKDNATVAMITDEDGVVLSSNMPELVGQECPRTYMESILSGEVSESFVGKGAEGNECYVTFRKSDSYGWYLVEESDYASVLGGVKRVRIILCISTALMVVLGIVTAYLVSHQIYEPIRQLLQHVNSKVPNVVKDSAAKNEAEYLEESVNSLLGDINEIKGQLQQTKDVRRNAIIRQLLDGEIDWRKEQEVLLQYGLSFPYSDMAVIQLELDGYQKMREEYPVKDIRLFLFIVQNVSQEILGNAGYQTEWMEDRGMLRCIVCANGLNLDSLEETLRKAFGHICSIQDIFTVSAGIGTKVGADGYLPDSLHAASQAMEYRLLTGHGSVSRYSEEEGRKEAWNLWEDRKLVQIFKSSEEQDVLNIIEAVMADLRLCRISDLKLMMNQIGYVVLFSLNQYQEEFLRENDFDRNEFIRGLNDCDTLEYLEKRLQALAGEVYQFRKTLVTIDKKAEMVTMIRTIIAEQYGNPGLSVDGLAEQVGLSANYVRQIFKKQTGQSLSEYIQDFRMTRAKELLLGTSETAKNIARTVGYEDNRYFYVVFKRITGMTADEYRNRGGKGIETK